MTVRGALPLTMKPCVSAGSVEMLARPMIRMVSPTPGIRNNNATRGSLMMLRSESMRLLPRRSGISSVFGSATRTNPRASPRGEQSSPSGGERNERRRLDEFLILRIDVIDLFDDRRAIGLVVERRQRFQCRDAVAPILLHE